MEYGGGGDKTYQGEGCRKLLSVRVWCRFAPSSFLPPRFGILWAAAHLPRQATFIKADWYARDSLDLEVLFQGSVLVKCSSV